MRNRRQSFDLKVNPDIFIEIALITLLGFLIWYIPPTHILIILGACILGAAALYTGLKYVTSRMLAALVSIALGLTFFLYLMQMLDPINGFIVLCLCASLGILMTQK
jgi:hypothetical protein